jgi:hypothetical protein
MSGLVAMGVAAIVGTSYSIYAGQQSASKQDFALRRQKRQQAESVRMAQSEQRKNEMAINKSNRRSPDISQLMMDASMRSRMGAGSTMLTGPQGTDPNSVSLSRNSLLGG